MPGGFVKLYGSLLLGSSLMEESLEARWLFMVFLSAADQHGFVRCQTVGNAARLANLTYDQAKAALDALSSPDPKSTTPDHDGRRIIPAKGGWSVVNYSTYREMRTEAQTKKAERQRRYRERKASTSDAVDAVRSEVSASASLSDVVVSVEGGVGGTTTTQAAPLVRPVGPANPLIAGRRPEIEREGYRLIREIAALDPDLDPTDILLEAAKWETKDGRFKTKVRLETMSDDHLIRTVHDLKGTLEEVRADVQAAAKRAVRP